MKNLNKNLYYGALIGNVMEFYNFTVYAFLSDQISYNFFPKTNEKTALLLTFSIFATGYITRPIGALFFGYIGDKYGRKPALSSSILLATITTLAIGILPNYNYIGYLAPFILIILRLLQGFAVSGEEGGAAVYLSEVYGKNKLGYIGGLVISSIFIGIILASFVCYMVNMMLDKDTMLNWGWRVPYILSVGLGIYAYKIRIRQTETQVFLNKKNTEINPTKTLFINNYRKIISLILMCCAYCVSTCVCIVYLPIILKQNSFNDSNSLLIANICLILIALLTPYIGRISDQLGHIRLYTISCAMLLFLGYPLLLMISSGSLTNIILGELMLAGITALISAPLFALLTSSFPTGIRYSAVSLIFNGSISLFSSTTPLMLMLLSNYFINASGLYLIMAASLSMVGAFASLNKINKYQLNTYEV